MDTESLSGTEGKADIDGFIETDGAIGVGFEGLEGSDKSEGEVEGESEDLPTEEQPQ